MSEQEQEPHKGRAPGTPNKVTAAMRARIEDGCDPIGFLTRVVTGEETFPLTVTNKRNGEKTTFDQTPTLDQRIAAATKLSDKLLPPAKSRTVKISLPKVETAADIIPALGAVMAAVADGELTVEEGAQLSSLLEMHRKAIETADLEKRLAALEAATGGPR